MANSLSFLRVSRFVWDPSFSFLSFVPSWFFFEFLFPAFLLFKKKQIPLSLCSFSLLSFFLHFHPYLMLNCIVLIVSFPFLFLLPLSCSLTITVQCCNYVQLCPGLSNARFLSFPSLSFPFLSFPFSFPFVPKLLVIITVSVSSCVPGFLLSILFLLFLKSFDMPSLLSLSVALHIHFELNACQIYG